MKRRGESISLAAELAGLAEALKSAQLIAELLANDSMPSVERAARAPRMLEATLGLVVDRLHLLNKVVVGTADVGLLVNPQNRALKRLPGDDPDVILRGGPRHRR
jgi:hypothetical protein